MKSLWDSLARAGEVVLLALVFSGCRTAPEGVTTGSTKEFVGQVGLNRFYTPANQVLTPAGVPVELPGLRPQALALSPDGKLLVTSGKTRELVVLEPATGRILQRVPLPPDSDTNPAPGAVNPRI